KSMASSGMPMTMPAIATILASSGNAGIKKRQLASTAQPASCIGCVIIWSLSPPETPLVIRIVKRAFAEILGAQAPADEDDGGAFDRVCGKFVLDVAQRTAQDDLTG